MIIMVTEGTGPICPLRERSAPKKRKTTDDDSSTNLPPVVERPPKTPKRPIPFRSASADRVSTPESAGRMSARLLEHGNELKVKDGQLYCVTCQVSLCSKKNVVQHHFGSATHDRIKRSKMNQSRLGDDYQVQERQAWFNKRIIDLLAETNTPFSIVSR